MHRRTDELTDVIRGRILAGLRTGALVRGGRVPSTRDLAEQLDVDQRRILAAYRALAADGLVEVRERSGIYVATDGAAAHTPPVIPERWLVEVMAQGVARDLPAPSLHEWLRRSVATVPLRAAAIAGTIDQVDGLGRELSDDYGFRVTPVPIERLDRSDAPPRGLRSAHLLVTIGAHAARVQRLGEMLRRPVIVVTVRADLVGAEWRALLRAPVYVVMRDANFATALRQFLANTPGVENIRPVVLGRDDLAGIPAEATTYITQSARARLEGRPLPGRPVPTARLFSPATVEELLRFVVHANLAAFRAG